MCGGGRGEGSGGSRGGEWWMQGRGVAGPGEGSGGSRGGEGSGGFRGGFIELSQNYPVLV